MHQPKLPGDLEAPNYEFAVTPAEMKSITSKGSVVLMADTEKERAEEEEADAAEYKGAFAWKYVVLRISIVALLVVSSVVLQDHFLDLSDFIGASCITMSCIILPIAFYLKKLWPKIPTYEKIPAILVVIVCFVLGGYVSYTSGKALFSPEESDPEILFPFCKAEDQREIYYNATVNV